MYEKNIFTIHYVYGVLPASCKLPGTTKRPSAEDAKTGEYKTVPIEERFRESLK